MEHPKEMGNKRKGSTPVTPPEKRIKPSNFFYSKFSNFLN
jgi:hypothetical protein